MKKLTMIFTVLFTMLMTSFSQYNEVKVGSTVLEFKLYDGTNYTTDLTVAVNPNSFTYPDDGGVMIITFDDFIDFTDITSPGSDIGIVGEPDKMILDNGAVYGVKFTYDTFHDGVVYINYNPITVFTFLG